METIGHKTTIQKGQNMEKQIIRNIIKKLKRNDKKGYDALYIKMLYHTDRVSYNALIKRLFIKFYGTAEQKNDYKNQCQLFVWLPSELEKFDSDKWRDKLTEAQNKALCFFESQHKQLANELNAIEQNQAV